MPEREAGSSTPQEWDAEVAEIGAALQGSAGFARWQLQQQLADAEKGRANAYKIAQLSAETSRYGVDAQRATAMAQLKENARQFEKTHGLDVQKFGLSVADSYTKYSQTPDMVWALNDFKGAMGRVGLGQGVAPISTNPDQPVAKNWGDFAALAGFSQNPSVQANQSGGGGAPRSTQPVGGGGVSGAVTDANGDGVPDPRQKAIKAVTEAIPPSATPGNDEQDWAALNAVRALYFAGKPGSLEALGPARRKIAQAGMARLGYDPALAEQDYQRGLPGQRNARAY